MHPDDKDICEVDAVMVRELDLKSLGPVEVSMCAPCAAAHGVAMLTSR
jgi:hypothetical protein